ncbi:PQQ-binding-like beta-propeller repeat protein, partial [Streptomyces sp. NPDC006655]|uniref:outer membrane protein assembly factor BamB family protein n=1 Tax=Streptomyces sp. NPDC006655 TaxID=3156898 RepID=UPI003456CBEB
MTGVDVGDRTLWKVPGGGIPYRTPAIADGAVYVLDDLFDLVAVDADTGQRRWTLPNDSPIEASPVAGTGVVYFAERVAAGGGAMELRGLRPEVRRVLELTGTDGRFAEETGPAHGAPGPALGAAWTLAEGRLPGDLTRRTAPRALLMDLRGVATPATPHAERTHRTPLLLPRRSIRRA